jgi:esterase/lipase superfamily enzyme
MELLVFGHAGARVLVFPTSLGKFYEWEDRGMIAALGDQIENGWLQLYCVDSVDAESWYAWHKHPGARAWRQTQYDRYLCDEVLPLSRAKNPNIFGITTGASFGAYHAMNFGLRHPDLVGRVLSLSGMFDVERWVGNYRDDQVYYNCPCLYLPNEHDPGRLHLLRGGRPQHRQQPLVLGDAVG